MEAKIKGLNMHEQHEGSLRINTHPRAKPNTYREIPSIATLEEIPRSRMVNARPPE